MPDNGPRPLPEGSKALVIGIANRHSNAPGALRPPTAFDRENVDLLREAAIRAPIGETADTTDIGFTCAFLATRYARRLSGATLYVGSGANIMA